MHWLCISQSASAHELTLHPLSPAVLTRLEVIDADATAFPVIDVMTASPPKKVSTICLPTHARKSTNRATYRGGKGVRGAPVDKDPQLEHLRASQARSGPLGS